MIEFNNNIQTFLDAWKISQDDLGKRLGLGRGIMNNIIKEKTRLTVEQLMILEELTGFSARQLLFGKINRLDVSERPLSREDGLIRLANSNINIQMGDGNGAVIQQLSSDERAVYEERLRDKEEINRLLRQEVAYLKGNN